MPNRTDEPALLELAATLGLTPNEAYDLITAPTLAMTAALESIAAGRTQRHIASQILDMIEVARTGRASTGAFRARRLANTTAPCEALLCFDVEDTEKGGTQLTRVAAEGKERRAFILRGWAEYRQMTKEARVNYDRATWSVLVADVAKGGDVPKAATEAEVNGEEDTLSGVHRALKRASLRAKDEKAIRADVKEERAKLAAMDARAKVVAGDA